ncbi:MAG: tRNA pseudouridine(54/55) synthase Pus10 [Promethearchaeota archaeon]|jgi:tRNA pseudouridine synthase 10
MIFEIVLKIYKRYYLCVHCLGRMFSLLGTHTTNQERGNSLLLSLTMENHKEFLSNNTERQKFALSNLKILAENANYVPAQEVLRNEGIKFLPLKTDHLCYLCQDIFKKINKYGEKALNTLEGVEFNNFLVGSKPDSHIINREDDLKSQFKILEAESFKSHFNRELGKFLSINLNKPPEFNTPDVSLVYSFDYESSFIDLKIKSLFIRGRYNKFIRGIPQTHWLCKNCMGKGCTTCNFSGKQYLTSVEELISPEFVIKSKATDSKFHGAGREDIDVRMLGEGRPFVLELRNPQFRTLDLKLLEKKVNHDSKKKIKIRDLRLSNKKEVIYLKNEASKTKKVYKALIETDNKISKRRFEEKIKLIKKTFENNKINQRTPVRVSHRRADKVRNKIIYQVEGKLVNSKLFEFVIKTQGGTYIKELIHGDSGRTTPSFTDVFEIPLVCRELDVLEIII